MDFRILINPRTPCGFDIFNQELMWLIFFTHKATFLVTSATLVWGTFMSLQELKPKNKSAPYILIKRGAIFLYGKLSDKFGTVAEDLF